MVAALELSFPRMMRQVVVVLMMITVQSDDDYVCVWRSLMSLHDYLSRQEMQDPRT